MDLIDFIIGAIQRKQYEPLVICSYQTWPHKAKQNWTTKKGWYSPKTKCVHLGNLKKSHRKGVQY